MSPLLSNGARITQDSLKQDGYNERDAFYVPEPLADLDHLAVDALQVLNVVHVEIARPSPPVYGRKRKDACVQSCTSLSSRQRHSSTTRHVERTRAS